MYFFNLSLDYPSSGNKIGDGPEGPEVKLLAEDLDLRYRFSHLYGIEIPEGSKYEVFAKQISKLKFPLMVEKISAFGKNLIFNFGDQIFLWSQLGLEGKWKEERRKYCKLILDFGNRKLYYDDMINYGHMYLFSFAELEAKLEKDVGIDLLGEEYPEDLWLQNLELVKYRSKSICVLLLDQKLLAGIGNYARAEILYRARIHPFRKPEEMTEKQKRRILFHSKRVLWESYSSRGCTIRSYENFDGAEGDFRCHVYLQTATPKGEQVEATKDENGRKIYWVPSVQKK